MKTHAVSLGSVQETLLIPLYGRAVESKKKRGLLVDRKAVEMVESIDYDFRKFDNYMTLFGSVLRTAMFDEWIKQFLVEHPSGTVIEIGAGLNTRFERLDNGKVHWFDMDLPDSMELRKKFFDDSERRKQLSASVLEETWFDAVKAAPGPYFFVIEAVFMYLNPADVKRAVTRIAQAFPSSRIALDTAGAYMVNNQRKHAVMKNMEARFAWACDDPREVERFGGGLRLLDSRTFANPQEPIKPKLPFVFRRLMLPLVRLFNRRIVETYKVNLYEVGATI
ncbi:class I SAM-dependent methyltransferase [Pendulispora brunnea]|uniref:Class I SAM-dependent methyltransferase n=1 Tax=Pendulispora brunnea TaxID=2905690 RepID=A0ABZ2KMF7_9BACT